MNDTKAVSALELLANRLALIETQAAFVCKLVELQQQVIERLTGQVQQLEARLAGLEKLR